MFPLGQLPARRYLHGVRAGAGGGSGGAGGDDDADAGGCGGVGGAAAPLARFLISLFRFTSLPPLSPLSLFSAPLAGGGGGGGGGGAEAAEAEGAAAPRGCSDDVGRHCGIAFPMGHGGRHGGRPRCCIRRWPARGQGRAPAQRPARAKRMYNTIGTALSLYRLARNCLAQPDRKGKARKTQRASSYIAKHNPPARKRASSSTQSGAHARLKFHPTPTPFPPV